MKKWILLICGFIVVALIAAWGIHHKNKPIEVKTVSVIKGNIVENAQAVGYIKPQHSSTVKSQIDGTVAEIYHWEGEYVKKGTPLLKVTPAPSPTQYAQAKSDLREAASVEKSAQEEINRYEQALKIGFISSRFGDLISAKKEYESAKLKRILAEQKLALIEKGKTIVGGKPIANIVKSPINGYILGRAVDVGDPVISLSSAQASTALFSMANMEDLMFQGSVDEADAAKIKIGAIAAVAVGALPGIKIIGKVTKIALQSDNNDSPSSSSSTSPFNVGFQVEATQLKIPKSVFLRSGYSATADIKIKEAKKVLVLPERTLHFDHGKPYVLLPSKEPAKPKRQFVTLGISDGISVEIKKGLHVGEKVLDNADSADSTSS